MSNPRTWVACVAAAALMLLGADLRSSTRTAGGQPAGRGHASSGTAVVDATNLQEGTVTLSGDVYAVVPATRIVDAKGELIPLKKLPVARVFRDEPRVDTDAIVNFQATETSRGWVLEYVKVQGQLPR